MQDPDKTPMTLPPIAVDLDDTWVESLALLARLTTRVILLLPLWLFRGIGHHKRAIAQRARLQLNYLHYLDPQVRFLRQEQARGWCLVPATAADSCAADAAARHLQPFDQVPATGGKTNLKGQAKLETIRAHHGGNFAHTGDSAADLPIWIGCEKAILVCASTSTTAPMSQSGLAESEFAGSYASKGGAGGLSTWFNSLRVRQMGQERAALRDLPSKTSLAGKVRRENINYAAFNSLCAQA